MTSLTPKQLCLLAGAASAALLLAALGFQAAGYAPCELCVLQRWPHVAAVAIAALIWLTGWRRVLALAGLVAAAVATGLALYHSGVELGLWAGPAHCSGGVGDLTQMSTADLMSQLQAAPVVRCDEPALRVLGTTMANWNALASAVLTVLWAMGLRSPRG